MPALATPVETTCGPLKIKEWPATDRPRERLRTLGPHSLSSRELLTLLIETGRPAAAGRPARSAMDIAGDLLAWALQGEEAKSARDRQPLRRIMNAPLSQLCSVPGIGPARAARILAALELGRRAVDERRPEMERLRCSRDVFERMKISMRDLPHEEFRVLLLNLNCDLLREVVVGKGSLTACGVTPREVFKVALGENAHSMVVVHNHPSGEPSPSPEDKFFTTQLDHGSKLVGVELLDHIIVGEDRYHSFSEHGDLPRRWPGVA